MHSFIHTPLKKLHPPKNISLLFLTKKTTYTLQAEAPHGQRAISATRTIGPESRGTERKKENRERKTKQIGAAPRSTCHSRTTNCTSRCNSTLSLFASRPLLGKQRYIFKSRRHNIFFFFRGGGISRATDDCNVCHPLTPIAASLSQPLPRVNHSLCYVAIIVMSCPSRPISHTYTKNTHKNKPFPFL